ncbi:redoxin domain-containing protein [Roseateles sp. SL47]|uniref:redoxin domain-containing protein n=1 Tax=Roseateles sp. SL47 TaxID=2995138 RepID=UPI00227083E5|nr:redoxin domain-containing protein [Roseateles sp. SL47]WAC74092.1 redoxin domain-containing protein [Roseateles sp. SL47]
MKLTFSTNAPKFLGHGLHSATRRGLLIGAALVAVIGPVHAQAQIDQAAPAFSATTADGKTLSLDSLRGKTVVLEWTNHDCPYVKKHYGSGNIPALQKEAAVKGVVWLQVISSAPGQQGHVDGPTAIKLNEQRGATPANTLLDPSGQIGKAYGAQTSPHLFIINPQGVLVYKGGIDSIATAKTEDIAKAEPYVKTALTELTAGKKVSQANTRPYGCSIKYAS